MSLRRVSSVLGLVLLAAAPSALGQAAGPARSGDIATAYRAPADSLIRGATARQRGLSPAGPAGGHASATGSAARPASRRRSTGSST